MRSKKGKAAKTVSMGVLNMLTILMAFLLLVSVIRLVSEMRSSFVRDSYNSMEYSGYREGCYRELAENVGWPRRG